MMRRVAVFVDGENVSADHAPRILALAEALGSPEIVRVYGNAAILPKWDGMPGFRFIHSGTGKNATDILLTVQVMEAALRGAFAAMVVASSDRDLTHLVTRIRELGVEVVGVGEAKAPGQFRAACTRFEVVAAKAAKPVASSTPAPPQPDAGALDFKLRDFIKANSKNGQGVPMHQLGPMMHARHGIRISTHPERTWRAYLLGRPALFDLDPKGPEAKVRFKPSGFTTQG
jgi:hypothetical protein